MSPELASTITVPGAAATARIGGPRAAAIAFILAVVVIVGAALFIRRQGYAVRGRVIVRCRDGHLFTTTWVPGVSLKAIRLGAVRFQRCPVGNHVTFVTPVRPDALTEAERRSAELYDDGNVP